MVYLGEQSEPKPKFKKPVQNEQALKDNDMVNELMDLIGNFAMQPGDFSRASSWGEVRGRAVLIDYGLTQEVYDEYYSK